MELLISIIIVSIIILSLGSIDLFSRHHVIGSERRAKLQNEISHALEHMTKNISGTGTRGGAIGDLNQPAINTNPIGSDPAIRIRIDSNNPPDGIRDASDVEIAYRYRVSNHEIWYYLVYPGAHEIITPGLPAHGFIMSDFSSITSGAFTQPSQIRYDTSNNYLEVQLTGCWDPATAGSWDPVTGSPSNATPENPCVTMQASIKLPGVSVH